MPNKVLFGPEKLATASTPGISIANGMGIKVNNLGELYLYPASSTTIKAGTNIYVPIMPTNQHESVFYGLAKAAGDSTQAASSNTVGTYTANAKTAIQNMLSVAPTNNPVFTGSISLGRYAGSTVGENSLAIGDNVVAQGAISVALGVYTKSWEAYSFSGGTSTQAWSEGSFAYGGGIVAAYPYSAAFGHGCAVPNISDWEANKSYSIGDIVYAQGYTFRCKVAHTSGSTFSFDNNWEIEWGNVLIVGNGDATSSNALTLHNSGRLSIKDYIYVNANADGTGGTRVPHDIQINGTSIVSNGVANIPEAGSETYGVLKTGYSTSGLQKDTGGYLKIYPATSDNIKAGTEAYRPIVPYHQHETVFYGLAKVAGDTTQTSSSNTVGNYTEIAKSKISEMLDSPVTIASNSVNIEAHSGIRYVCGEMTSITFTAPETGCVDLLFKSGSTPTTLTVTSAKSGVTAIAWANGFNPAALEANTTYEINILDGEYGVACKWT